MSNPLLLWATCAPGVEPLLAQELAALGVQAPRSAGSLLLFQGDLQLAYRVCLWSRLASRVLRPLAECEAESEAIYRCARAIDWPQLFDVGQRFRVDVSGISAALPHSGFAALRVKDAIADRFRETLGRRPDSGSGPAPVVVHLRLAKEHASVALDLSGESLHRRGYRLAGERAPLKETLAAAILVRAQWPRLQAAGGSLLDPMCGSGTLAIEAALMAADIAPGLSRSTFAFQHLADFDAAAWQTLRAQAQARRRAGLSRLAGRIFASDADAGAVAAARANASRAGLGDQLVIEQRDLLQASPPGETGLVITNPPYGERLGAEAEVIKLMSLLGHTLRSRFGGWHAAIFTARPDLALRLGLRARRVYTLDNGPIPCKLLCFEIPPPQASAAVAAEDFANRLAKNHQHLGRWARRTGIGCYRVYDADLPDYALAVDLYQAEALHAVVQEYVAPATVDPVHAQRRLRQALVRICERFELPAERLHLKLRQAMRRGSQYPRLDDSKRFHTVEEHGCRLLVNFDDYLDTGLFLDHRPLRRRIQSEAAGKRFLNLFCYTGSATVHAARGGAAATVSVDLSPTYLEWARRNLRLNAVPAAAHALIQADAMAWLREQAEQRRRSQFDLILCDTPTFSNSKRTPHTFDVQRDHLELLRLAGRLLADGGVLYFSCNRRRFRLDPALGEFFHVQDITQHTVDPDFTRPPPPHRCWRLSIRPDEA